MRARTVCSQPGCPTLTNTGRCPEHRRAADRARGTRRERGYGWPHDKIRADAISHATPATPCSRCDQPLGADYRAAHLDHNDDRTGYLGLSHPTCNLSAAGHAAHP